MWRLKAKLSSIPRLHLIGGLLFSLVLLVGVGVAVFLVQRFKILGSRASGAPACTGLLAIQLSTDGKNPQANIGLPAGVPTKYYVHVTSGGQPCQSNFDVFTQNCDGSGNNCGAWKTVLNWGTYRPNDHGILRADLDAAWPNNLTVKLRLRPAGTQIPWSNEASMVFSSSVTNTLASLNMQDYLIYKPGYTFIYNTENKITGQSGTTRIQMEERISRCGLTLVPWRYTKSNQYAYWGPYLPGLTDGQHDLRWFIVDPSFSYSTLPAYNNYLWGFADTNYQRGTGDNAIRDIQLGSELGSHVYRSLSGQLPSYNLAPKYISQVPYISYLKGGTYYPVQAGIGTNCSMIATNYSPSNLGSWKVRVEKDYVDINNGPGLFNYSGEAIRADYYEGGNPLETTGTLRESWYYVKGIGLVEVLIKLFNNYGQINTKTGQVLAPACKDDSDCWDDDIQNPLVVVKLKNYFQNPTLSVAVSTDGTNYSSNITTTQAIGYYLKVTNTSYTGYLEASLAGGTPAKWLWVQDGVVFVSPQIMSAVKPGVYNARFRIWVPNETIAGETRLKTTQLAWSNQISVNVVTSLPSTPTPTPTTGGIISTPISFTPTPTSATGCSFSTRVVYYNPTAKVTTDAISKGSTYYVRGNSPGWTRSDLAGQNYFSQDANAPCWGKSAGNCAFTTRSTYYDANGKLNDSIIVGSNFYNWTDGTGWWKLASHDLASIGRYKQNANAPCFNYQTPGSCQFQSRYVYIEKGTNKTIEFITVAKGSGADYFIWDSSSGWWPIANHDLASYGFYRANDHAPCYGKAAGSCRLDSATRYYDASGVLTEADTVGNYYYNYTFNSTGWWPITDNKLSDTSRFLETNGPCLP